MYAAGKSISYVKNKQYIKKNANISALFIFKTGLSLGKDIFSITGIANLDKEPVFDHVFK